MALTIGTLVGYLKIDRSQWSRGLDRARKEMDRLGSATESVGRTSSLPVLAMQAAQVASAVAPAAGALLALPAVLGVVGIAMGTVKAATAGMGDAMKAVAEGDAEKLAEALQKLSPNARAFVMAWAGLREQFKPIQQAVQDKLFSGLDKDITGLAKATLPALGKGMTATAGELNALASEGIKAASTPMFSGELAKTGTGTAAVLAKFRGAIAGIPGALLSVVNVGMPFIETLAGSAAAALKARTEFLGSEAGAERMRGAIQRGVDTVKQLIAIGGHLKASLAGVWAAATGGGSAGNVLDTIERLAQRMSEWINSTAGQTALHGWFQQLAQVGQHVAQVLPQVIDAAQWLVGALNSLPAPVQEFVIQATAWSIVLGPIAGKLTAVGGAALSLLKGVGAIGSFTASVYKIVTASTAAQAATAKSSAGIVARMTAAAIAGTVSAAKTVASWVAMAATSVAQGAVIAASWVATQVRAVGSLIVMAAGFVAQGAVMVASVAVTVAGVVAGWVTMAAQSLAQAARMAASWLIAMGPVGWVIAAVIGLVALIVANWDTVVEWTKKAWAWVVDAVVAAAKWIWNLFLNWSLPGLIIKHWDKIVAGVRSAVNWVLDAVGWIGRLPGMVAGWFSSVYHAAVGKLGDLLGWLGGLGGRILGALGNLGSLLLGVGRDIIDGLIRGIQGAFQRVRDTLANLTSLLPDWKGPARVDAKLLTENGRLIIESLIPGFRSGERHVERYLTGLTATLGTALAGPAPVIAPVVARSSATAAGSGGTGQDRPVLHIEHASFDRDQSPQEVAERLDWEMRKAGR